MRKKLLRVFSLMLIISCSTIFSHSLINIIYDGQGNKILLYDDHTWLMNDEGWNDKANNSQFDGKYVIKEDGMSDLAKMMLISEGTYPGTDEWLEYLGFFGIAMKIYSAEDLLAGNNFYIEINKNQMKFTSDLYPSDSFIWDRVDTLSSKSGFYIQDNNLFVTNENEEYIHLGHFKAPDNLEIDLNILRDTGDFAFDDCSFVGYEKYLLATLEKE